jgi:hypothetical protein
MQQFRVEVCTLLVAGLLFFVPATRASELTQADRGKWPRSRILIAVSSSLINAPNIQGDTANTVQKSIADWSSAADVRIETVETEVQNVSPKGVRGDGVSLITAAPTAENVRLFPDQADSPAAATRIFTDRRGNITEADIVLNPFVKFSTDGTFGTYDLQSVLTHEIGHLLGLDHSPAWGSVMFAKTGASFGPTIFAGRRDSLPEADAASVRALFGAKADDDACCGVATGRITGVPLAKNERVSVWIEELATGRLAAAATVSNDGVFELGGIREGAYRIRVAAEIGENQTASVEQSLQISVADLAVTDLKLVPAKVSFTADLFGTTPQIARLPGIVRSMGLQTIFIGGKDLDTNTARMGISGTDILIGSDALRVSKYSNSVKVISFDLPPGSPLSEGEYTLLIEDSNGVRRFLIGALVVLD